ncbi:hypothetical protein GCM10023320_62640 [Pseudonocardia adelaidensis]|uniref:Uncharacterized protein n=2 Tax=Pseudonocardia adelaidensis TaxID=648754 RepID=A0ABP9NW93_9PSEU
MNTSSSTQAQRCTLPDCDAIVVQPECGGVPQIYCSREHRRMARKLRSIARAEADPVQVDTRLPQKPDVNDNRAWLTNPFSVQS